MYIMHTGVLRSMHCNPDFAAEFLPVDICTNAIIAATWERGLANDSKDVEFRNIVSFHMHTPCAHTIKITI